MLSANDARSISGNDKMSKVLEYFESRIRKAAEKGQRDALLEYVDSVDGNDFAAFDELRRNGFEVKVIQETINGTPQCPAYFAIW